jgi:hypothetical protein
VAWLRLKRCDDLVQHILKIGDLVAAQLTGITTEQFFDQVPTLNPRETAHVQVSVDFPSSPTDHAIVAVYTYRGPVAKL